MPLERACRSCTGNFIPSGTKPLYGVSGRSELPEIIPAVSRGKRVKLERSPRGKRQNFIFYGEIEADFCPLFAH